MQNRINQLLNEEILPDGNCNLCRESSLAVGQKTDYGAVIVCRVGDSFQNGWFATLSPKTGGLTEDFSIQIMPWAHLTHFSQVGVYPDLAKNYGIIFSKISQAMTKMMATENNNFDSAVDSKEKATSIATYGKCTNWKEKKEHLHIKIFPFRGNIGQPYTVDSSFERKEVFHDNTDGDYVKMRPVKKKMIDNERFDYLSNLLISLLK